MSVLTTVTLPITTQTGTYTATESDRVVLANGTFTINLFAAANNVGRELVIRNIASGNVTVDANGSETIDGNTTYTVTGNTAVTLICDGTRWWSTTTGGGSTTSAPLVDDGNSGTSKTITWSSGSAHYLTLTGNCTLTFSSPTDGGRYILLVNSGAGSFYLTWPANVKWGPAGQPPNTIIASKVDMFTMAYVASTNNYYMSYSLNY